MGEQEPVTDNRRFGIYLRRIREGRKLSLDAVEEMSTGYPERITKSHLSRIENGQALPTFPRLFALSQIYGVPVSSIAERFEMEYRRETLPAEIGDREDDEILEQARKLRLSGLHGEAMPLYEALIERRAGGDSPSAAAPAAIDPDADRQVRELRLHRANCMVQLQRFASAKDECEDLLSETELEPRQRVLALQYLAMCCYKLGKFTVAMLALEQAERELPGAEGGEALSAHLTTLRGRVLALSGRPREAVEAFGAALRRLERLPLPFEACRARINLSDALMRSDAGDKAVAHLKRALKDAESAGYERLRALALSNLAELAYNAGRLDAAESHCLLSNSIARPREFYSVVFRNCFYLWKIAQDRGDRAGVKANERALRAYLSRAEEGSPEARAYRAHLTGGGR